MSRARAGPGVTRLILWRHGQTEWNPLGRFQGQIDVALSDLGRQQAADIAARLAAVPPDALVSSDLSRAADTAAALARLTGLPMHVDARLRERFFGDWQGRRLPEIAERWPAEYARWQAGDPSPGCGIEDAELLVKRAGEALREAADRFAGGTVVVATHGGAARAGIASLLGWPPEVQRTLAVLANCHWTELSLDETRGWQLRAHNVSAA